jgi:hypothetical protein
VVKVVIRDLGDLPRMLRALERHIEDDVIPQILFMLGEKMVEAIQDRIHDSRFGTNNAGERAGKGADKNADYTLNGEDPHGIRYEDNDQDAESSARPLRFSIYGMADDYYGKVIRGAHTQPLMETGNYVSAFEFLVRRDGDVWRLHPDNEHGAVHVEDRGMEGPMLWEVHEYGWMDSPPRPHIWPGMKDVVRSKRRDDIEKILKREVLKFLTHHVQVVTS